MGEGCGIEDDPADRGIDSVYDSDWCVCCRYAYVEQIIDQAHNHINCSP